MPKDMKVRPMYLVGTHIYSYRRYASALVIGVVMVSPDGKEDQFRPCFHVLYQDGSEDYVPIFGHLHQDAKNPDIEIGLKEDL